MVMNRIRNYKSGIINQEETAQSLPRGAGFTVIEIVVAIMIFSIIMVLVISIFARAMILQRRIVGAQRVQENSTLVLESMAKEIRVSTIQNQDSLNCTATTITMNHPVYGNITYSLVGGNILRQSSFTGIVNSTDVTFTKLNFCITGSGSTDQQSPKITVLLSLKNTTGEVTTANLETTVTSRDISSELRQ